ncbi:ABC transporter permease [Imperialibacter roseus]|uniref:ABC transporter permease n=1 Tax=Imperialibacter roseus TaxID=1324217 RepID=A0ABZ0IRH1_9BACT|nr:ABC transporter permease [Imperialibacter roseus]WOK07594.1 ABC transporter permease [Imperialibacter roseus]|tara:strand:+ start:15628 stop:18297 length:2670 start_codon:yes stop_codon:yes gene_type:complete
MEPAQKPSNQPPGLGTFLLRNIYSEELFEEIHGDLLELYEERIATKGRWSASAHYIKDAVLSARNYDLKRTQHYKTQNNSGAMIRNYIKITLRTISKNKVYTALNVLGLALGMAACIFIMQYVAFEKSYDRFNANFENLYRIQYNFYREGELQFECAAAVPRVGPFMKEKMPEVVDFARAYPLSMVVSYNNINFREDRIHIADPAFLKIFTFPLIKGDVETCLTEPNTVVISETAAKKYFGNEDPIGKMIRADGQYSMAVTAVAKDVPNNSHIKFDFLISYQTLNNQTDNQSETAWGWYDFNSYVLLRDGTDPTAFNKKFAEILYEERHEEEEKYNYRQEFPLQPITDIHLYSNLLQESEPDEAGDGEAVFFLTIIAAFILVIAWINYINLSTARSVERAKEVGVRKVMGAFKAQLIGQFITESFVMNLLAFTVGLAIVTLGINQFNALTDSSLGLSFLLSASFWLVAALVVFIGSFLSGLYPAFVLSSYQPSTVLKGKMTGKKGGILLRKALVIFQFASSVCLIAGTLIVYQQLSYVRNLDLGFDMTETLVVKGPGVFTADSLYGSTMQTFRNELLQNPEITAIASGTNVPGDEIFWANGIKRAEEPNEASKTIYIAGVDYDYFPAYDIKLVAGRNYDRTFGTDTGSLILNEAGAKYLGFQSAEEAINQKLSWGRGDKTIIGIVENYNQMSAKTKVTPLLFPLVTGRSNFFTIKLDKNGVSDLTKLFNKVEASYSTHFPGNPFDYFFLDDFFNRQYNPEKKFSRVFTLFAGFAIVIACLGLFGLSSFNALQKTKEIGIRKAIGADVGHIVMLLSKEFVYLVLIANIIAWPATWFIMNNWLDNFAYRIAITPLVFIVAGLLVLVIAVLTVGYKTMATAKSDPVKALRYE